MKKYVMKDVNGTGDANLKITIVGAGLVSEETRRRLKSKLVKINTT